MPQRSFIKHIIKGTLVGLIALVICLALGEVLVRAMDLSPEIYFVQKGRYRLSQNPATGYEPVPHFSAAGIDENGSFRENCNSLGFRDREHDLQKAADSYRIMVIGDSVVEGLGIDRQEDIFTSVLERELAATAKNTEVLNFGVNGYNTLQEIGILKEKGLQFTPDLVVVAYCVNDSYIDSGGILAELKAEETRQNNVTKLPPLLAKSALCCLIWAVSRQVDYTDPKPGTLVPVPGKPIKGKPAVIDQNSVAKAFKQLQVLSEDHGFEVLVVTFPFLNGIAQKPHTKYLNEIIAQARQADFLVHNLTADIGLCAQKETIAADTLHPNVAGSLCVGKSIAGYLTRTILCD